MFSWWLEQPSWLRYGVAVLFLLISTVLWIGGTMWPWGWGVGVALLLLAGKSDSEKKGYRF